MTVRLWPSVTPSSTNPKASNNTVGTEFEVSAPQALFGIWFYSTPATTNLPTKVAVWDLVGGAVVPGSVTTSPSWSGAVGSGWVKVTYDGSSVILSSSGKYAVTCYNSGAGTWQNRTASYWSSGAGSAGVVNGALSAPSLAASLIGQGVTGAGDALPNTSGAGLNYWVDVEVGDPPVVPVPGEAAASRSAASASSSNAAPSASSASRLGPSAAPGNAAPAASSSSSLTSSAKAGNQS
jgi:hypothetical protein